MSDNKSDKVQAFFVQLAEAVLTEYEGDEYTGFDENAICMFMAVSTSCSMDDTAKLRTLDIPWERQSFFPKKVTEMWDFERARADMFANHSFYKSVDHDEVDIVQTLANCFPWLLGDICAIFSGLPSAWELRVEILFILGQLMFGYLHKIEQSMNTTFVRDDITRTASYKTTRMYFRLLDSVCARASKGKKSIPDLLKENHNVHGYLNVKLILRSKMLHRHLREKIICPLRDKKYRHLSCPAIDYFTDDCNLRKIFSAVHSWQNFAMFLQTTYNLSSDTFACYASCSDPSDYLLVLFATHGNLAVPHVGESKSHPFNQESSNYFTMPHPTSSMSSQVPQVTLDLPDWRTARERAEGEGSTFHFLSYVLDKMHITQSYMYALLHDTTHQIIPASVLLKSLTTLNNSFVFVIRELCVKQKDVLVNLIPSDALSAAASVNNIAVGFGICNNSFAKMLLGNDVIREAFMRLIQNWIDIKKSNSAHSMPVENYIHLHRLMHCSMSLSILNKAAEAIDKQMFPNVVLTELK
ncbi:U24-like protein [Lissonota sp. PSUC_FEM 10030012]|nr:U24-like protein [Lissonota sp. PSUC_FEM 10030012]